MRIARVMMILGLIVGYAWGAKAEADTFGLTTVSVHVPHRDDQNDLNLGLYWKSDNGITAGAYNNTLGRLSVWGGLTIEEGPWAITGGIVWGYKQRVANCVKAFDSRGILVTLCGHTSGGPYLFAPLIAPSVRLPDVFGLTPRLTLIPGFRGDSTAMTLAFEHQF